MEEARSFINPTIEKGSLVLVTGANGFIASHCVDQFLDAGYAVRGTVRSLDKADWLYELFDAKYGKGKFEAVVVPDMAGDGAYDAAVKGVSGICHTASVLTFSPNPDEVIPPVVKGALNILTAATREPGVKSLVYTSSSMAALTPQPDTPMRVEKTTWNDEAVRLSSEKPDPWNVYGASKTEAERAIWKAVESTKPPFQVAAVLPNANFGTILSRDRLHSSSTGSWVGQAWNGERLPCPPQWFVDVQDTARLHVIAVIDPACNGERIFAFAEPFNCNAVLSILRKQNPGRKFIEDDEGEGHDISEIVPRKDAEALLQKHYSKGFTSLEKSIELGSAFLK